MGPRRGPFGFQSHDNDGDTNHMATVTKGATGSNKKAKPTGPKLAKIIEGEQQEAEQAVSFVSRRGADGCYIIPAGPVYAAANGVQVGWDEGVYLDFRGVGVTRPYYPETNSVDRTIVARIKDAMADGRPICADIGLEILQPEQPRPPFAKWDTTSAPAIKVALTVQLDEDDHDANVEVIKQAARYEKANLDRDDVMQVLDSLLAVEAADSDAFSVQVSVS